MTYRHRWVVTGRAGALMHAHSIYIVATAHCRTIVIHWTDADYVFFCRFDYNRPASRRFTQVFKTIFYCFFFSCPPPSKSRNVPKNTFHDILHPTTALAKNQQSAPHRSRDREDFSSTTFQAFTACDFSIHPLNICLVHSKTTTGECFPYAAIKQQ